MAPPARAFADHVGVVEQKVAGRFHVGVPVPVGIVHGDQLLRIASLARRVGGEPLQYLIGHQAFRRLDLAVGPGVLVPRPETEMLVEHALGRVAGVASPVVVDVGTGSGAIALSIAVERPDANIGTSRYRFLP